jgi:hypothetical protein
MAGKNDFENLFEAALTELNAAVQPTVEVSPVESAAVETEEQVETPIIPEAVAENAETTEEETKPAENGEANDTGRVTVTDEDVILLPDGTEVSVKEAVLRQRDYTRKTQALADERKAFEDQRASAQSNLEYVESLQKAWQTNQAEVVSGFIASAQDPTLVLSQAIVDLAKQNKLDPQFLDTFGITAEVREKWVGEVQSKSELADVKARLEKFEQEKLTADQSSQAKQQEDVLIAEYEAQWEQIATTSGLTDPAQAAKAKIELLQYALENGIPNLQAAWKAQQYEKGQSAKPVAKANKAAVDAKKLATGAITSKSAGGSVVTAKQPGNIEDAVWSAFQELTSKK